MEHVVSFIPYDMMWIWRNTKLIKNYDIYTIIYSQIFNQSSIVAILDAE